MGSPCSLEDDECRWRHAPVDVVQLVDCAALELLARRLGRRSVFGHGVRRSSCSAWGSAPGSPSCRCFSLRCSLILRKSL